MAKKKLLHEEIGELDPTDDNSELADLIVSDLKKSLGDVAYIIGRDESPSEVPDWLSTGSTMLDMTVCNNPTLSGGIPVSRLTEIYGDAATGKSLLAYQILSSCQKKGGIAVLIDTENSANWDFLKLVGLDPNKNLIYIQVDTIEEVFTSIERVITKIREGDKNKLCAIVWDSVAGTTTKAELQGDFGDSTMGLAARLIGQGLRKTIRYIGSQKVALIFLNQIRQKIGQAAMFGSPNTTPGGKAIPFFASTRIELLTAGKIKNAKKEVIGVGVKAKVVKNRFGPPFRETIFNIYFDRGTVEEEFWLECLIDHKAAKAVNNANSTLEYKGEVLQFKNKDFRGMLTADKDLYAHCKQLLKNSMHVKSDSSKMLEDPILEMLEGNESI